MIEEQTSNYNVTSQDNDNLFDKDAKIISKEAVRRYIEKLKENEDGKNLSTIDKEILTREIERIYGILYDNILITKLYEYKTKDLIYEVYKI